jgi:hypothetical protein
MQFVELGKFDPTNTEHVDYVKSKRRADGPWFFR